MVDVTSRLRLVVDSTGVDKAGRKLKDLRRGSQRAEMAAQRLRTVFAGLAGVLGTLASRSLLQSFNEQARSMAKVEQAVRSTGGAAGFASAELAEVASQLQGITLFGDEEILNGVTAQLLTFTNIAENEFIQTQKVALDLATVLDQDLKSASIQLGKALNDPIANLSALSRSGIQFSESQKEVIKKLAESGRLAEAQGVMLEELERQYGGQAEAAARVGTGLLKQLQNVVGDIGELMGANLFNSIEPAISQIHQFLLIDENQVTIIRVIEGVAAAIGLVAIPAGLAALGGVITALATRFGALAIAIGTVVAMRDDIAEWAFGVRDAGAVVQASFEVLGPLARQAGDAAVGFARNNFEAFKALGEGVTDLVNGIRERLSNLIPPQALGSFKDFARAVISIFVNLAQSIAELMTDALLLPVRAIGRLNEVLSNIDLLPDNIQAQLAQAAQQYENFAETIDNNAGRETIEAIGAAATAVVNGVKTAADGAVEVFDDIKTRAAEISNTQTDIVETEKTITRQTEKTAQATKEIVKELSAREKALRDIAEQETIIAAARLGEREERIAREILSLRRQIKDISLEEARALAEKNVFLDEQLEIIREQRSIIEAPFDNLSNNLRDAILNGGRDGVRGLKDAFNGLIRDLKNAFLNTLFDPLFRAIQNIPNAFSAPLFGGGFAGGNGVNSSTLAQTQTGAEAARGGFGAFLSPQFLTPSLAFGVGAASGNPLAGIAFGGLSAIGGGALVSQLGRLGVFGNTFSGSEKFIANQLGQAGSLANIGGGLAGSVGSSLLFGNSTGVNIGSTIGGIAGNLIPIPLVGPLIGSLLGGFVGSLFGSGGSALTFDLNTGADSFRNKGKGLDQVRELGQTFTQVAQTFAGVLGATIDDTLGVRFRVGKGGGILPSVRDLQSNAVVALAPGSRGVNDTVTNDPEEAIRIALGLTIDNIFEDVDEVLGAVAKGLLSAGESFDGILETVQIVSDLTQDIDSEPISEFQRRVNEINETFDAVIAKVAGVIEAENALIEAREKAIQAVTRDFDRAIQDDISKFLNGPLDQLEKLLKAQEERFEEAQALSANIQEVERLAALELKAFFQGLSDEGLKQVQSFLGLFEEATNSVVRNLDLSRQDLQAQRDFFLQSAQDFASLRTDLNERFIAASPRESLDILRARASELLTEVGQGNQSAATALPQVLNQLIESARQTFGNTKGFTDVFNFVQEILSSAEAASIDIASEAERQIAALDESNVLLADIRDILASSEAANAFFTSFSSGGVASSDELLELIQSGAGLTTAVNDNASALSITGLIAQSISPVIIPLAQSIDNFTLRLSEMPNLMRLQIEVQERGTQELVSAIDRLDDRFDRIEVIEKRSLEELERLNRVA